MNEQFDGSVDLQLNLDTGNYLSQLAAANGATEKAMLFLTTQANAFAAAWSDVTNNIRSAKSVLSSMALYGTFSAIADAATNAASAIASYREELERTSIAAQYFIEGTNKAERSLAYVQNMKDFAIATSFSTADATRLSRYMASMGIALQQSRSVMTVINDAIAATGNNTEAGTRIVTALGQMLTKGKLAAEEMRQLANANIPVYQILTEQLGLSPAQLKSIGNAEIPADRAVEALLTGLEDRYKGAAKELAQTNAGLVGSIKDSLLDIGQMAASPAFEAANGVLLRVRDVLLETRQAGQSIGPEVMLDAFLKGIDGTGQLADKAEHLINTAEIGADALERLAEAGSTILNIVGESAVYSFEAFTVAMQALSTAAQVLDEALQRNGTSLAQLISTVGQAVILYNIVKTFALVGQAIAAATTAMLGFTSTLAGAIGLTTVFSSGLAGIATAAVLAGAAVGILGPKVKQYLDSITKISSPAAQINAAVQDSASKYYDEFNESFKNIADEGAGAFKLVEKSSDKAADKATKKWLAAFDEVYQVPEEFGKLETPTLEVPNFTPAFIDAIKYAFPEWPTAGDIAEAVKPPEDKQKNILDLLKQYLPVLGALAVTPAMLKHVIARPEGTNVQTEIQKSTANIQEAIDDVINAATNDTATLKTALNKLEREIEKAPKSVNTTAAKALASEARKQANESNASIVHSIISNNDRSLNAIRTLQRISRSEQPTSMLFRGIQQYLSNNIGRTADELLHEAASLLRFAKFDHAVNLKNGKRLQEIGAGLVAEYPELHFAISNLGKRFEQYGKILISNKGLTDKSSAGYKSTAEIASEIDKRVDVLSRNIERVLNKAAATPPPPPPQPPPPPEPVPTRVQTRFSANVSQQELLPIVDAFTMALSAEPNALAIYLSEIAGNLTHLRTMIGTLAGEVNSILKRNARNLAATDLRAPIYALLDYAADAPEVARTIAAIGKFTEKMAKNDDELGTWGVLDDAIKAYNGQLFADIKVRFNEIDKALAELAGNKIPASTIIRIFSEEQNISRTLERIYNAAKSAHSDPEVLKRINAAKQAVDNTSDEVTALFKAAERAAIMRQRVQIEPAINLRDWADAQYVPELIKQFTAQTKETRAAAEVNNALIDALKVNDITSRVNTFIELTDKIETTARTAFDDLVSNIVAVLDSGFSQREYVQATGWVAHKNAPQTVDLLEQIHAAAKDNADITQAFIEQIHNFDAGFVQVKDQFYLAGKQLAKFYGRYQDIPGALREATTGVKQQFDALGKMRAVMGNLGEVWAGVIEKELVELRDINAQPINHIFKDERRVQVDYIARYKDEILPAEVKVTTAAVNDIERALQEIGLRIDNNGMYVANTVAKQKALSDILPSYERGQGANISAVTGKDVVYYIYLAGEKMAKVVADATEEFALSGSDRDALRQEALYNNGFERVFKEIRPLRIRVKNVADDIEQEVDTIIGLYKESKRAYAGLLEQGASQEEATRRLFDNVQFANGQRYAGRTTGEPIGDTSVFEQPIANKLTSIINELQSNITLSKEMRAYLIRFIASTRDLVAGESYILEGTARIEHLTAQQIEALKRIGNNVDERLRSPVELLRGLNTHVARLAGWAAGTEVIDDIPVLRRSIIAGLNNLNLDIPEAIEGLSQSVLDKEAAQKIADAIQAETAQRAADYEAWFAEANARFAFEDAEAGIRAASLTGNLDAAKAAAEGLAEAIAKYAGLAEAEMESAMYAAGDLADKITNSAVPLYSSQPAIDALRSAAGLAPEQAAEQAAEQATRTTEQAAEQAARTTEQAAEQAARTTEQAAEQAARTTEQAAVEVADDTERILREAAKYARTSARTDTLMDWLSRRTGLGNTARAVEPLAGAPQIESLAQVLSDARLANANISDIKRLIAVNGGNAKVVQQLENLAKLNGTSNRIGEINQAVLRNYSSEALSGIRSQITAADELVQRIDSFVGRGADLDDVLAAMKVSSKEYSNAVKLSETSISQSFAANADDVTGQLFQQRLSEALSRGSNPLQEIDEAARATQTINQLLKQGTTDTAYANAAVLSQLDASVAGRVQNTISSAIDDVKNVAVKPFSGLAPLRNVNVLSTAVQAVITGLELKAAETEKQRVQALVKQPLSDVDLQAGIILKNAGILVGTSVAMWGAQAATSAITTAAAGSATGMGAAAATAAAGALPVAAAIAASVAVTAAANAIEDQVLSSGGYHILRKAIDKGDLAASVDNTVLVINEAMNSTLGNARHEMERLKQLGQTREYVLDNSNVSGVGYYSNGPDVKYTDIPYAELTPAAAEEIRGAIAGLAIAGAQVPDNLLRILREMPTGDDTRQMYEMLQGDMTAIYEYMGVTAQQFKSLDPRKQYQLLSEIIGIVDKINIQQYKQAALSIMGGQREGTVGVIPVELTKAAEQNLESFVTKFGFVLDRLDIEGYKGYGIIADGAEAARNAVSGWISALPDNIDIASLSAETLDILAAAGVQVNAENGSVAIANPVEPGNAGTDRTAIAAMSEAEREAYAEAGLLVDGLTATIGDVNNIIAAGITVPTELLNNISEEAATALSGLKYNTSTKQNERVSASKAGYFDPTTGQFVLDNIDVVFGRTKVSDLLTDAEKKLMPSGLIEALDAYTATVKQRGVVDTNATLYAQTNTPYTAIGEQTRAGGVGGTKFYEGVNGMAVIAVANPSQLTEEGVRAISRQAYDTMLARGDIDTLKAAGVTFDVSDYNVLMDVSKAIDECVGYYINMSTAEQEAYAEQLQLLSALGMYDETTKQLMLSRDMGGFFRQQGEALIGLTSTFDAETRRQLSAITTLTDKGVVSFRTLSSEAEKAEGEVVTTFDKLPPELQQDFIEMGKVAVDGSGDVVDKFQLVGMSQKTADAMLSASDALKVGTDNLAGQAADGAANIAKVFGDTLAAAFEQLELSNYDLTTKKGSGTETKRGETQYGAAGTGWVVVPHADPKTGFITGTLYKNGKAMQYTFEGVTDLEQYYAILKAQKIYGYADGGITNGPVLAGEAGPEAVVPLDKRKRSRDLAKYVATQMLSKEELLEIVGLNKFADGGITDLKTRWQEALRKARDYNANASTKKEAARADSMFKLANRLYKEYETAWGIEESRRLKAAEAYEAAAAKPTNPATAAKPTKPTEPAAATKPTTATKPATAAKPTKQYAGTGLTGIWDLTDEERAAILNKAGMQYANGKIEYATSQATATGINNSSSSGGGAYYASITREDLTNEVSRLIARIDTLEANVVNSQRNMSVQSISFSNAAKQQMYAGVNSVANTTAAQRGVR